MAYESLNQWLAAAAAAGFGLKTVEMDDRCGVYREWRIAPDRMVFPGLDHVELDMIAFRGDVLSRIDGMIGDREVSYIFGWDGKESRLASLAMGDRGAEIIAAVIITDSDFQSRKGELAREKDGALSVTATTMYGDRFLRILEAGKEDQRLIVEEIRRAAGLFRTFHGNLGLELPKSFLKIEQAIFQPLAVV